MKRATTCGLLLAFLSTSLINTAALAQPADEAKPAAGQPAAGQPAAGQPAAGQPAAGRAPEPEVDERRVLAEVPEELRLGALKLFNEGRAMMMEAGKLDAACETLAKSYEQHNRGDTLLNLAECHRRQGKTATAWREFDEAIRYAEQVEFAEAIDIARKLRDELAKSLSQLIVDVPTNPAPPKGLVVVLDGKRLPREQWSQQLFVDPGLHIVTASAEGYDPFDQSVEVKKEADRAAVTVALKKIPPPPPPPNKPPPPPPPVVPEESSFPVWSVIVGATGVAMLGVSVAFGVDTVNVGGELDDQCTAERQDCPADYDFASAHSNEVRSYGIFVGLGAAGVAATAVGVVGLIMGLSEESPKDVAIAPWASPTGAGFGIAGSWH